MNKIYLNRSSYLEIRSKMVPAIDQKRDINVINASKKDVNLVFAPEEPDYVTPRGITLKPGEQRTFSGRCWAWSGSESLIIAEESALNLVASK